MIWIQLASVPLALVFIGWMVATAWRRRWRTLLFQLAGGIAYVGILWAAGAMHQRLEDSRYFEGLFSTPTRLTTPLFRHDSPRAFNGDGYSFAVYPLPPEIRRIFENFDRQQLADFPRRPAFRSHWKTRAWHPSPAVAGDRKYIDFALSGGGSPELARLQADAKRALATAGGFIGYFYFDHGAHPGNVDLFIIDLERQRLFLINLNT